jgi:hypothetical protein
MGLVLIWYNKKNKIGSAITKLVFPLVKIMAPMIVKNNCPIQSKKSKENAVLLCLI